MTIFHQDLFSICVGRSLIQSMFVCSFCRLKVCVFSFIFLFNIIMRCNEALYIWHILYASVIWFHLSLPVAVRIFIRATILICSWVCACARRIILFTKQKKVSTSSSASAAHQHYDDDEDSVCVCVCVGGSDNGGNFQHSREANT